MTTSGFHSMAPYTISISNKSGLKQSYAIIAEPPHIKSSSTAEVTVITSIISAVRGVASGTGEASFILSKSLFATCGTYDVEFDFELEGAKSPIGTGTEVVDQRPVKLGCKDSHGVTKPGTLLEVDASDGCPVFSTKDPEFRADLDCFAMKTMGNFTTSEAKMNKFVLGFSSSLKHAIGPYATFTPSPGEIYQIKPARIFYLIVGSFNSRDLYKMEDIRDQGNACKIDFGELGTDSVQLTHDEHNVVQITILADS